MNTDAIRFDWLAKTGHAISKNDNGTYCIVEVTNDYPEAVSKDYATAREAVDGAIVEALELDALLAKKALEYKLGHIANSYGGPSNPYKHATIIIKDASHIEWAKAAIKQSKSEGAGIALDVTALNERDQDRVLTELHAYINPLPRSGAV